jgi:hypothetical protein
VCVLVALEAMTMGCVREENGAVKSIYPYLFC